MQDPTGIMILFVIAAVLLVIMVKRANGQRRRDRSARRPVHERRTPRARSGSRAVGAKPRPTASLWQARVVYVIDGDTVIVEDDARRKVRIRLAAIDCPEAGQPWGDTARYGLIKLIGRRTVRVAVHDRDHYGRTVATLHVQRDGEWINVNERMVMLGHAWVMRRYWHHLPLERQRALDRLERWARSRHVGLWKTPDPVPPWQWRRGDADRSAPGRFSEV